MGSSVGECLAPQVCFQVGLEQGAHLEGQLPRDAVWDGFGVLWVPVCVPWSGCSLLTSACVPQNLPEPPINWGCPVAPPALLSLLSNPGISWDREGALPPP